MRRYGGMKSGAGVLALVFACGDGGAALQKSPPVAAPTPDYSGRQIGNTGARQSPFDDQMMHEMEEKRGKALNNERQRLIVRDANQLVQAAAELEAKVSQDPGAANREDEAKRAETIEKLARSVKDRMRGSR